MASWPKLGGEHQVLQAALSPHAERRDAHRSSQSLTAPSARLGERANSAGEARVRRRVLTSGQRCVPHRVRLIELISGLADLLRVNFRSHGGLQGPAVPNEGCWRPWRLGVPRMLWRKIFCRLWGLRFAEHPIDVRAADEQLP